MAKATVQSLTAKEQALIAETQRSHLQDLDEDQIGELLTRVRRARDKHVILHRQAARERVSAKGARGLAAMPSTRSASKAEIFEDALARVSTALAKAARQSAAELKAERLAAARPTPTSAPSRTAPASTIPKSGESRSRARKPIEKKKASSSLATGARRQAKRDSR